MLLTTTVSPRYSAGLSVMLPTVADGGDHFRPATLGGAAALLEPSGPDAPADGGKQQEH